MRSASSAAGLALIASLTACMWSTERPRSPVRKDRVVDEEPKPLPPPPTFEEAADPFDTSP